MLAISCQASAATRLDTSSSQEFGDWEPTDGGTSCHFAPWGFRLVRPRQRLESRMPLLNPGNAAAIQVSLTPDPSGRWRSRNGSTPKTTLTPKLQLSKRSLVRGRGDIVGE